MREARSEEYFDQASQSSSLAAQSRVEIAEARASQEDSQVDSQVASQVDSQVAQVEAFFAPGAMPAIAADPRDVD